MYLIRLKEKSEEKVSTKRIGNCCADVDVCGVKNFSKNVYVAVLA